MQFTRDHRRLRYQHEDGTVKNPDEVAGREEPIGAEDIVNLKIALETEVSLEGFMERV